MIKQRSYRNSADFRAIGDLICQAWLRDPAWNAWTFARFDIWAQRRLADEQVYRQTDWQQRISLWESDGGLDDGLVGAALIDSNEGAVVIGDPRRRAYADAILDWIEESYAPALGAGSRPHIEVMDSNLFLQGLLIERGYVKPFAHYIRRHRDLDSDRRDGLDLPAGFTVKVTEDDDLERFLAAVQAVFSFQDRADVYRLVMQAPSCVPELNLAAVSPKGEVASFCTVWLDRQSNIAEFEPVGTLPSFRRRGLARALLLDACNRLRDLGCRGALVSAWSESAAANALYASVGLKPLDRHYDWERSM